MSIQSEITRISGNVSDALDAIANKGVTVPAGSTSDDLADLIGQIPVSGGGGGLEYETGTWTPTEDVAYPSKIFFSNTHTSAPLFVLLADAADADTSSKDTNVYTGLVNLNLFLGHPCATENGTTGRYAVNTYGYAAKNATSVNTGTTNSTSSSGMEQNYFDSAGFFAKTGSNSRYWKSGRTYKWIAVWPPTT